MEKAWTIFTDESRMGDWLMVFESMETISGNPGEVGSKYRMIFVENGDEMVIMEEVTAFQENKLFGFTLDADPLISDVKVKFTGDESKTEITATIHVEGKNLLWKSTLRLMKSMIANRGQRQYDKLKEIIESASSEPMSVNAN
ncbi:SRPBCC family protein [candidate division KSB1 bacterium]|nr:SRPBCC family protein [candidate division KSB1 bacterium]